MDVLLIGSRGREHALALALKKDERVNNIFCIPGNGGLAGIATCIKMDIFDFEAIAEFLDANPSIKLTVVNPDELLSKGLVEFLTRRGHRTFGCDIIGANLEGCKSFANDFCHKYGIPAPSYRIFEDYPSAKKYVQRQTFPLVIKTDGRTAGKGILFCKNQRDAENALYDIMVARLFGDAGKKVDVEEFISGTNIIVSVITDGETVIPLPAVENYKRVYDGNLGMSTAGMGASMPAAVYTEEVARKAYDEIFLPTIESLRKEGCVYKGWLCFSLIVKDDGRVFVVDFVSRPCDVESQLLIPQIETPLIDVFNAVIDGKLADVNLHINKRCGVCVVATSGGYPLDYNKNVKITLGDIDDTVSVFHAGTKIVDGELKTSGGRVLAVVGFGETKKECVENVYSNIAKISFDGMHYRKDIGKEE